MEVLEGGIVLRTGDSIITSLCRVRLSWLFEGPADNQAKEITESLLCLEDVL